ncbi:chromatin remodeling complex subunit [Medicago truncatula]|uniref:Chromatin remodeling complex subunit n=1 Tax=Medicago truncatula TaxID=3880 RepID=G7LEX3_MEDTR|nr:chromatin remodeling complex subunit [Medicago truncatula]
MGTQNLILEMREQKDKGILLTTYDIVHKNTKSLGGTTWDYTMFDEGHLIKNPSTQRTKCFDEIPSIIRIIISGTPLQNKLKELWALYYICCPELLGPKEWFKLKYEKPINGGSYKNATDRQKRISSSTSKILKKICDHPLLLTKRAAEDVLNGMDSMLKPNEVNVAEILVKHITDVVKTYTFKDENDVPCKISFIMSLLGNLIAEGHRVLIFSQTRMMLNFIQECITSKGYDFLRMDGTTIFKYVDFQDVAGPPIFLLTSKVGGIGLTLTRADRVIVVDPDWNPRYILKYSFSSTLK